MERMRGNTEMSAKRLQRVENIVGGMENPTKKLLLSLSPQIEAGQYQMILGIDASGRLPTLVIANVIKGRYGDLGFNAPAVRFLAGGFSNKLSKKQLDEKNSGIDNQIKEWIRVGTLNSQQKILIIEDTAITGGSIQMISDALAHNDIQFDAAALT